MSRSPVFSNRATIGTQRIPTPTPIAIVNTSTLQPSISKARNCYTDQLHDYRSQRNAAASEAVSQHSANEQHDHS